MIFFQKCKIQIGMTCQKNNIVGGGRLVSKGRFMYVEKKIKDLKFSHGTGVVRIYLFQLYQLVLIIMLM